MTLALEDANVSARFAERAVEAPARVAVRDASGRETRFDELDARSDAIAAGLLDAGLAPGDRVCVFVRPGADLIALVHGCFRARLVPVLIDPGMGRRPLLACVERSAPRGFVGVPRAQVARHLFPRAFASVEVAVTAGTLFPGHTLASIERRGGGAARASHEPVRPDDVAAILFTSGSTGPPKGVVYRHGNFAAQLSSLAALYDLAPGEVDVACFPLFALFDNALGMTSVFPALDPSRPGRCDPAAIVAAVEESGATFTFGSPAIWRRVLPWLEARGRRFSTLRRITIAGAPVPPALVAGLRARLAEGGDVHTPYGATEALPVASLSGAELEDGIRARSEAGEGTCVGRPAPGIELALVAVSDDACPTRTEARSVPRGEIGEVCVRGPVVTTEYADLPDATARAKMVDADGTIWHRMGDLGRLDDDGLLWFCGRKSHRIETAHGMLTPVPSENVLNLVEGVRRTALVAVGPRGAATPQLVVELEPGQDAAAAAGRLRARARDVPACVEPEHVLFHPGFPVDVRHNAKIHRGELARWARPRIR